MRTIALPVLSTLLGLFQGRAYLHLDLAVIKQRAIGMGQVPGAEGIARHGKK